MNQKVSITAADFSEIPYVWQNGPVQSSSNFDRIYNLFLEATIKTVKGKI